MTDIDVWNASHAGELEPMPVLYVAAPRIVEFRKRTSCTPLSWNDPTAVSWYASKTRY